MIQRFTFSGCRVEVNHRTQTVHTIFPDGTHVEARPTLNPEAVARAQALGYRAFSASALVWEMTRQHDLAHAVLAEAEGHGRSPVIWGVAHPDQAPDAQAADLEERRVMLLVRAQNDGLEAAASDGVEDVAA